MASKEYEAVLRLLLEAVQTVNDSRTKSTDEVPVGISNRHVHLSQADLDTLFGQGYKLTPIKERVLGPVRGKSQIEILAGDGFKLGIKAPAKLSGDLTGTPGITIVGPKGAVQTAEGVIVAQRHIHMTPRDAENYGVHDGQIVKISVEGPRGGVYGNVVIRATDTSALECHIDTEEANAMGVDSSTIVKIIK